MLCWLLLLMLVVGYAMADLMELLFVDKCVVCTCFRFQFIYVSAVSTVAALLVVVVAVVVVVAIAVVYKSSLLLLFASVH